MPEITPQLDNQSDVPLYRQLYEYIKLEIKMGKLRQKMNLPSKRKLASYLNISQNTVETAYNQLVAEGYIEAVSRKGYFVCLVEPNIELQEKADRKVFVEKTLSDDEQYTYNFSHTGVDTRSFPFGRIRKIANEVMRVGNDQILHLGHPQGEYCLREAIAQYLYQSRGVHCSPSQMVIGAGSQYLFRLLFQLLHGSIFAVENPGYHRKFVMFEKGIENVVAVPLDREGIMISILEKSKANVSFVTPSHHFPCGMVMPISRRMQLLKWAEAKEGRFVIEDDYDSEFRYSGNPIPALQGLDKNGKVIYMGTFSKALLPSLRVSYMVLPEPLIKKYQEEYFFYHQTVSRMNQEILTRFIQEGYWEKHIHKMRVIYNRKRNALISAIQTSFPKNIEVIGQESGLHVLIRVHNGMNEQELIQRASLYKIKVFPVSAYGHSDNRTVLLGFGMMPEEDIAIAVQLLSKAWFSI